MNKEKEKLLKIKKALCKYTYYFRLHALLSSIKTARRGAICYIILQNNGILVHQGTYKYRKENINYYINQVNKKG